MKKAKYTLYGIFILIVLLLIAAVFLSKKYTFVIERKIDLPKNVVYNLIANLDNRYLWDSSLNKTDVISEDNAINFDLNGKEETIELATSNKQSDIVIKRYNDDVYEADLIEYNIKGKDITDISVSYTGHSSWPMNLFNIFTKRRVAKVIAGELDAMAVIANERSKESIYNGYKIVESIVKEKNFIIKRDRVATGAMQQFYIQNLGILFKNAQEAGLEMDGMPSGLFYTAMNEDNALVDMAAGIPVTEEVNIANASSEYIKPRKAVVVDYYGDYNNTIEAHHAIISYFADKEYLVDIPVIEEYVTDPTTEKDPKRWLTKITYYIVGQ